ncbi:type II toxin-antitoxin system death-on-curing family toxin [Pseudoflavonifractor sp. 524-17]|uniref:type II toxin-antitoxin system death-on-curing family toxin n=1 Tax=Pseudoflavonifractor sp. 524-17 TaxID=2304577 RepID=UPI00137AA800|nr:type II toxin-antitoxin system death-on-curing family toxin [Pseudoflavonifractor sp. 524-17]NCE64658.1 type II toxin-antitoxin system death-on-curing family toxin [Pseudoflavonifractor sp. 524-17]
MIWIEVEDVILIHSRIIQVTGGIDGLRDRASLEATLAAPLQSFTGEDLFPSDIEKIARLGYGLAANHAFIDGNKRIGAMLTQLLLKWNGYHLELQKGELADMFIAIADGSADEQDLLAWIRAHIR